MVNGKREIGSLVGRVQRFAEPWGLSLDELADRAGIDRESFSQIGESQARLPHTVIERLAEALCISADWLSTGRGEPIQLHQMTPDEQIEAQSGPGTEGLPGFVVTHGGPWYRDEQGHWKILSETEIE